MTKQTVWLTNYGVRALAQGNDIGGSFSMCSPELDMATEGWVKVMCLEIPESCLPSRDRAVTQTVDRLEEAAKKLQAETQLKLTAIQAEIGKLLSLENYNDTTPPSAL